MIKGINFFELSSYSNTSVIGSGLRGENCRSKKSMLNLKSLSDLSNIYTRFIYD